MTRTQYERVSLSALLAVIVCCAVGCAVDEEPPLPEPEVRPESRFKVMLDQQTLDVEGTAWKVSFIDVSDVVIHSDSEASGDGSRTATVSFRSQHDDRAIKAKVRIKYREGSARVKGGGEIGIFPIDEFTTLSAEKVGDW